MQAATMTARAHRRAVRAALQLIAARTIAAARRRSGSCQAFLAALHIARLLLGIGKHS